MNRFSATTRSQATVLASREEIWAVLTDPVMLPRLTPLLERIDADGDLWTWRMKQIKALGVGISPSFTEKMVFEEPSRIDYHHAPRPGTHERTGAEGWYALDEVDTDDGPGTLLDVSLTLTVELPLPRSAGAAVRKVMASTIDRTGDRFAANLLKHLGARQVGPSQVATR